MSRFDIDPGDTIDGTGTNFCALYDAAKRIVDGYEEWEEARIDGMRHAPTMKAIINICIGVAVLENILLEDGMEIHPQIRDYLCKSYEARLKEGE